MNNNYYMYYYILMENNKNIFNEIKELEEKKNQISKSINELNDFSTKLQDKLSEENIHIEDKLHQFRITKDKLKNDGEIKILEQENDKLEQFLQLLAKQYELELRYIEQYCDHKSKIEKMNEKYSELSKGISEGKLSIDITSSKSFIFKIGSSQVVFCEYTGN